MLRSRYNFQSISAESGNPYTLTHLFFSLLIAIIAASITYLLIFLISESHDIRTEFPWLVLAMPIVALINWVLKKRTLYYPYKVKDLHEMQSSDTYAWNRLMPIYHFIGASISHLFGASVGREGVVVLTTTGAVRTMNLSLSYWGPIAAAAGFAAITGNKWVGLIFIFEMFNTTLSQKVWTFIAGWIAVLILQSLNVPHLLPHISVPDANSVITRFLFVIVLAFICGWMARFFKFGYHAVSDFLKKKSYVWIVLISAVLGCMLYPESMRSLQSLSSDKIDYFLSGAVLNESDAGLIILKLVFTMLFVAIGFFGGEYVPLVVVGTGVGVFLAQHFGESIYFGAALSAFALFAGVSRLKWTMIVLTVSLAGLSHSIWIYIFYTLVVSISGDKSLYFERASKQFSYKFGF
ncbi:MAG: chloride channel protein [Pseudobdellovibrio sp.]